MLKAFRSDYAHPEANLARKLQSQLEFSKIFRYQRPLKSKLNHPNLIQIPLTPTPLLFSNSNNNVFPPTTSSRVYEVVVVIMLNENCGKK